MPKLDEAPFSVFLLDAELKLLASARDALRGSILTLARSQLLAPDEAEAILAQVSEDLRRCVFEPRETPPSPPVELMPEDITFLEWIRKHESSFDEDLYPFAELLAEETDDSGQGLSFEEMEIFLDGEGVDISGIESSHRKNFYWQLRRQLKFIGLYLFNSSTRKVGKDRYARYTLITKQDKDTINRNKKDRLE